MSIISTTSQFQVFHHWTGMVNMVQKSHTLAWHIYPALMPSTIPPLETNPRYCNHCMQVPIYQLIAFRPFTRRRIIVNRPFLSVLRAKKPERRFCTRREGRNVLRFTPSEAVAENERVCGGSSDEIDGARDADVEGVWGESVWGWVCWRRVGVERRVVEKGR